MGAHRMLIRSLVAEVRKLRVQLDEEIEASHRASERLNRALSLEKNQVDKAESRACEAESAASEQKLAVRALERARERGDYWGERRARESLFSNYG
jgi:hypothetical protein